MRRLKRLVADEGSQAAAARALGVHRSHVLRMLRGEVGAGPRILKRLGLERVTEYREVVR